MDRQLTLASQLLLSGGRNAYTTLWTHAGAAFCLTRAHVDCQRATPRPALPENQGPRCCTSGASVLALPWLTLPRTGKST